MKIILGLMLIVSSFAFAQVKKNTGHSYGYMLLDNGNTYTIRSYFDQSLVPMFNPQGYFTLPEEIEATGSNYYVDKEDVIYTTDADGWLYKKMHYLDDHSVRKAGGVFFISSKSGSENDAAHIVKVDGVIEEHHAEGFNLFDNAKTIGGVYFLTRSSKLVIANPYDGKFYQLKVEGKIKRRKIAHLGHNYILMEDGTMHVIGFIPRTVRNEDGSTSIKHVATVNTLKRNAEYTSLKVMGGTYFFNNKNELISINDMGQIQNKGKVVISSIGKDKSNEIPTTLGTSYFVYDDGEVYMTDKDGYMWFLTTMPFYERIGKTNKNFKD